MAHHQETDGVHAQLAGVFDVLFRHISLGAMGGDAHHPGPGVVGRFQVMHSTDAGQQQCGDLSVADHIGHGFDPFQVGVRGEAIVEARPLQAIAMGYFDRVDFGLVQRASDVLHVLDRVLMTHRVAAIAQGDVGDVEFLAVHVGLLRLFASTAPCARRWPRPRRS
ncbi:hypothetical protein D3C75_985130 [compost metagenome]